jgi:solute carrier family 25 protein 14/30|tara:strand:+ start:984 stop:1637 length:654 start_codon:yes stop_codon:yes gene_type:complete
MSYSSIRFGLYVPVKKIIGADDPKTAPVWKKICAGGLTGSLGSAIANPVDLIKTRMQADSSSNPMTTSQHFKGIFAKSGIRGFWLGVGPNVTRAALLGATKLATYDEAKIRLANLGLQGLPLLFVSSMMAGAAYVVTVCPADFARTRYMSSAHFAEQTGKAPEFSSGFDVVRKAVAKDGFASLYRGAFPLWLRAAPYTTIQFIVWENLCVLCGTNAV